MAKGYWIVSVDITDLERYTAYVAANAEPLKKYGARILVRAGQFENPEGTSRTRNGVIEFPSYQAALDCWNRPSTSKRSNYDSRCRPSILLSSRDTKVSSQVELRPQSGSNLKPSTCIAFFWLATDSLQRANRSGH